jgi:hypothetical protein
VVLGVRPYDFGLQSEPMISSRRQPRAKREQACATLRAFRHDQMPLFASNGLS